MSSALLLRPALSVASPRGARGRLSILIFHRVLREPDPLLPGEMDAARFNHVCRWLAGWFNVLPLDEAVRRWRDADLPARAAAITFDDGYADNHDVALPILQRHGLSATFFVATDFLDGGRMWNDTIIEAVRRAGVDRLDLSQTDFAGVGALPLADLAQRQQAIPRLLGAIKYLPPLERARAVEAVVAAARPHPLPQDLMMRGDQVQGLRRAGMGIGAHTASHPILARLDDDAAEREIRVGKQTLEGLLDEPVRLFAYPNGKPEVDYGPRAVDLVRGCGFDAAVSTAWGAVRQGDDRFQLPRFTPWDTGAWRFGLRMLGNYSARPASV